MKPEELSLFWALPFVGILLSIGLCPLLTPHFWHHHFGKTAFAWAALFAIPFFIVYRGDAVHSIVHILVIDYIPFIILLASLFTVSGGILIRGTLVGTPVTNTLLIAIGTFVASWIGTTGASMLLIRPVLRANQQRKYKVHTVIFFIFLVSNIGGSLTPLGDPPLFLGFLHGVPFFWTLQYLWKPLLVSMGVVALIYFIIDWIIWTFREPPEAKVRPATREPLGIEGNFNFLLLGLIIIGVLVSGYWKPTNIEVPTLHIHHGELIVMGGDGHHAEPTPVAKEAAAKDAKGEHAKETPGQAVEPHAHGHSLAVPVQNLARDAILIVAGLLSWLLTKKSTRDGNGFSWGPILEVTYLFFGIFITIIPALAILGAGEKGALAGLVKAVDQPYHYFWITGALSSFLDNAPTYLTFFNTALGRFAPGMPESEAVALLIRDHNTYLIAIALGAVYMGANTYIGNAPNFMVKSIAEEAGVKMPDFFSYMIYSVTILIPTFILITWLFFWK